MDRLTSHERIARVMEHKTPDRVPIIDGPWGATLERWHSEGMPEGVDWRDFFGVDKLGGIGVDNSPRYDVEVLEETDEYRIHTTSWGATHKDFKHTASVPQDLDFRIKTPEDWEEAKARLAPSDDRIDWDALKREYPVWRKEGLWIRAHFMFGFDMTHSRCVGTERLLMAMITDPDWCVDMFEQFLDLGLALLDRVWDAGYTFDCLSWPDDMGYKGTPFFSADMYRELLKPVHTRAVEWAHARGITAWLHSCGDIRPLLPDILDTGIDCLNPLEVKAGMDPAAVKKEHGDRLVLHGGMNVLHWDDPELLHAEIDRLLPTMMEGSGYIFGSDHSIPSSLSLEEFRRIVEHAKRVGSYD